MKLSREHSRSSASQNRCLNRCFTDMADKNTLLIKESTYAICLLVALALIGAGIYGIVQAETFAVRYLAGQAFFAGGGFITALALYDLFIWWPNELKNKHD